MPVAVKARPEAPEEITLRIFGVILAGGAARRMGTDKALVHLAGKPVIERVAERLSPQVEALAISANGDPSRFAKLGLEVLPDSPTQREVSDAEVSNASVAPIERTRINSDNRIFKASISSTSTVTSAKRQPPVSNGPLSGLLAALKWAEPLGATAVVSVPCDSPYLPPDLVPRLCLAAEARSAAFAGSGTDQHPTHALWPVGLIPSLEAFLASGAVPRLRDFAALHGAGQAAFPPGTFVNANSPADLARLEATLSEPK